jgi:hypothetical protein
MNNNILYRNLHNLFRNLIVLHDIQDDETMHSIDSVPHAHLLGLIKTWILAKYLVKTLSFAENQPISTRITINIALEGVSYVECLSGIFSITCGVMHRI